MRKMIRMLFCMYAAILLEVLNFMSFSFRLVARMINGAMAQFVSMFGMAFPECKPTMRVS